MVNQMPAFLSLFEFLIVEKSNLSFPEVSKLVLIGFVFEFSVVGWENVIHS